MCYQVGVYRCAKCGAAPTVCQWRLIEEALLHGWALVENLVLIEDILDLLWRPRCLLRRLRSLRKLLHECRGNVFGALINDVR